MLADDPHDGGEDEPGPAGESPGRWRRIRHWMLAAVALAGLGLVAVAVLWTLLRGRRDPGPISPNPPSMPGGTAGPAPSHGSPGAERSPGPAPDGSEGVSCDGDDCSGCAKGQEACDAIASGCVGAVSDTCSGSPGGDTACEGTSCGSSGSGSSSCGDSGSSSCGDPGSDCSQTMAHAYQAHPLTDLAVGVPPMFLRTRARGTAAARMAALAIRAYQRWISPRLPIRCRFRPTCSQYGLEAVQRYGILAGSQLALARIRRCGASVPRGSLDPVPAH